MRVLVECTHVYDHPYMNTGIQRVVRNIISKLKDVDVDVDVEFIPVIFKNDNVYKVMHLAPFEKKINIVLKCQKWIERYKISYWAKQINIDKRFKLSRFPVFQRMLRGVFWAGSLSYLVPKAVILYMSKHTVDEERIVPIEVGSCDTLVLLDSSWDIGCGPLVSKLKSSGVNVIAVIYDLIPLTHPQFCDANLVKIFELWFSWIVLIADGFMTISKTIEDQVREKVVSEIGEAEANKRWFKSFYLGSELDQMELKGKGKVRGKVKQLFARENSPYLMVSTIEPRKNHEYLLDAFELAWSQGSQAKLCIVGRIGWKCEVLIERIKTHAEYNERLFMLNDMSDAELEYAYHNSKSLVFPSFVEGFGLPLVEAMQRGLPVMASDIPVFREVCEDYAVYFDLDDSNSLTELIIGYEAVDVFPAHRALDEWRWINWKQSADQLFIPIAESRKTDYVVKTGKVV